MAATVNRAENGRDAKGRFARGNPGGGRPATSKEFVQFCQQIMGEHGKDMLLAALKDENHKYHWQALELAAAYAYGKPKQGLEVSGADGGPILSVFGMTADELQAIKDE